ncbi:HAD family hydrolase, partial [Aeromonas sp. QDB50]|uniref:HAD family hydrolase n=1 Tax=Aeromonas sp. QDB50 TaxID=2990493 RepID=UPI003FA407CE
ESHGRSDPGKREKFRSDRYLCIRVSLWQESFGYSDSHNDLPMLQAVSHPHAVNPAPALRQCAEELGWPLWTW